MPISLHNSNLPTPLRRTVGNPRWLLANVERLQQCFPEQWTRMQDLNGVVVGARLREAGVPWENEMDLILAMGQLQAAGIMRMSVGRGPFDTEDGHVVKRGPLVVVERTS